MKTLVLFVNGGARGVIPKAWKGFNLLVENESIIGHVADDLGGNLVEVIDVGFHGYAKFAPSNCSNNENFCFACADQVAHYIYHGPIEYDLIVAGQTPVCEQVILLLHEHRSALGINGVIRFSSYYGNPGAPHQSCCRPAVAGYDFDMPKDYATLFDFLTFEDLARIKKDLLLSQVIRNFNEKNRSPHELPILAFNT